jgi:hypothetical protein
MGGICYFRSKAIELLFAHILLSAFSFAAAFHLLRGLIIETPVFTVHISNKRIPNSSPKTRFALSLLLMDIRATPSSLSLCVAFERLPSFVSTYNLPINASFKLTQVSRLLRPDTPKEITFTSLRSLDLRGYSH